MNSDASTIRELLARSFSRYIKVTPDGLQLRPGKTLPTLCAQVLTFRAARTLYQNRKPVCRSLDGIQALTQGRTCASCLLRKACTPQICLEILYEGVPLRLLLAYTSARNFMTYVSKRKEAGHPIEGQQIELSVKNRGRWGEVGFATPANRQRVID